MLAKSRGIVSEEKKSTCGRTTVWLGELAGHVGPVGRTARPLYLKAFLIRESKNPFRQALLGNKTYSAGERGGAPIC